MDFKTLPPIKKPRLEWLDALRGFTMILVVAYHVCQQGFMMPVKVSSSMPFLVLFRMPLFFFVSGFLAYKANLTWNLPTLGRLTAKNCACRLSPHSYSCSSPQPSSAQSQTS